MGISGVFDFHNPSVTRDLALSGSLYHMTEDALLAGLSKEGPGFVKKAEGAFAFAYWDETRLMLARDPLGIQPLFFAVTKDRIVFGSRPSDLFALGVKPAVNAQGLRELFALGPAHTPGTCIYTGVAELLPGEYLLASPEGIQKKIYWRLESGPHSDNFEDTVERTAALVKESVERDMRTDLPLCSLLSGGLDSSLVTSICAKKLAEEGRRLRTFSFDFAGNDKFFQANAFQTSRDAPYALEMAKYLGTEHVQLECDPTQLADHLEAAMEARDLPGMADIDASLLYFCGIVGQSHKVALTGECADELFGGYLWFRSEEAFQCRAFPWSNHFEARRTLLREDVVDELRLEEYARAAYEASVAETPRLEGEAPLEARRREIAWLNLRWFMQTLLGRMHSCAAAAGIEARVPFAGIRLLEYVWNIPWDMKYREGHAKYLLRQAGREWLPDSVLWRKKSPYPKTHNPAYLKNVSARMRDLMDEPNARLFDIAEKKALINLLNENNDNPPWYGQLMTQPQTIAYFLQMNAWLEKFKPEIM